MYSSKWQQPIDFAIWQANDGTWQIWSCIRFTFIGGVTRLFHRWEGRRITDTNWQPMGIAMVADPGLGETPGGLQAPHVFKENNVYYMAYGDWHRICLARSDDGKVFSRVLNPRGQPDLFTGPYSHTRDPMLLEVGGVHVCYHMGNSGHVQYPAAAFGRTSLDLVNWSAPTMVAAGGIAGRFPGDCECPFVVLDFGVGHDVYRIGSLPVAAPEIVLDRGQYYIAALNPDLDGIRIARLRWAAR